MQQESATEDTTKHDYLADMFAELSESYYDERTEMKEKEEACLTFRESFTGLSKGIVRDITPLGQTVEITVDSGQRTHTITLENTGEYTQENELARFMEWNDISVDAPGEFFGAEVIMVHHNGSWNIYLPDSLDSYTRVGVAVDKFVRRFGFQWGRNVNSLYETFVVSFWLFFFFASPANILSDAVSQATGVTKAVLFLPMMLLSLAVVSASVRSVIVAHEYRQRQ